jgi:heterogeneous nuclear ribonucleoprotein G
LEIKAFVANLSWSTTEADLKEAFSRFGECEVKLVKDIATDRSRGFGFVTYTSEEALGRAISEMNGVEVNGRALVVNKANDRPRDKGPRRDRNEDGERREFRKKSW